MTNMTDSLFLIEQLAPITQYQDLGRFGQLHNGFSHSGPMDETAFRLNNHLLDNVANATQIEIGLGGLRLRAMNDCTIATSGADLNATLNGEAIKNFASHDVLRDDLLAFGYATSDKVGQYDYLGVAGGFDVSPFLDSCSTTQRLNIFPNNFSTEPLSVYHLLSGESRLAPRLQSAPLIDLPDYSAEVIQVIPAYQYAKFSKAVQKSFCEQSFIVKGANRMGTKLSAEQAINYEGGELLSEGIVTGAIQIPPDGNPIVLQKDAQSIGGYPKIGVVAEPYRSLLAQMPTGRQLRFCFATA